MKIDQIRQIREVTKLQPAGMPEANNIKKVVEPLITLFGVAIADGDLHHDFAKLVCRIARLRPPSDIAAQKQELPECIRSVYSRAQSRRSRLLAVEVIASINNIECHIQE